MVFSCDFKGNEMLYMCVCFFFVGELFDCVVMFLDIFMLID